ncbi:unnamed protein product, partial [Amoebophrya sp. A25]|eukprot:GSA25T00017489001.1
MRDQGCPPRLRPTSAESSEGHDIADLGVIAATVGTPEYFNIGTPNNGSLPPGQDHSQVVHQDHPQHQGLLPEKVSTSASMTQHEHLALVTGFGGEQRRKELDADARPSTSGVKRNAVSTASCSTSSSIEDYLDHAFSSSSVSSASTCEATAKSTLCQPQFRRQNKQETNIHIASPPGKTRAGDHTTSTRIRTAGVSEVKHNALSAPHQKDAVVVASRCLSLHPPPAPYLPQVLPQNKNLK